MIAVDSAGEAETAPAAADFQWRLEQPRGTIGDVELILGTMFEDWGDEELKPIIASIARKLQHTASVLLSAPLAAAE